MFRQPAAGDNQATKGEAARWEVHQHRPAPHARSGILPPQLLPQQRVEGQLQDGRRQEGTGGLKEDQGHEKASQQRRRQPQR